MKMIILRGKLLKRIIRINKYKFINLFVEIEALRTKLIEKEKELDDLKKITIY